MRGLKKRKKDINIKENIEKILKKLTQQLNICGDLLARAGTRTPDQGHLDNKCLVERFETQKTLLSKGSFISFQFIGKIKWKNLNYYKLQLIETFFLIWK